MSIKNELNKVDGMIVQHRQQIAMHQVAIANLETTRMVLLGLDTPSEPHAESLGLLNGTSQPQLIVRPAGMTEQLHAEAAEEEAHKAADRERKVRWRAERKAAKAAGAPPPAPMFQAGSIRQDMSERILIDLEKRSEPVTSSDLMKKWKINGPKAKQNFYQLIYELNKRGVIKRVESDGVVGFGYVLAK